MRFGSSEMLLLEKAAKKNKALSSVESPKGPKVELVNAKGKSIEKAGRPAFDKLVTAGFVSASKDNPNIFVVTDAGHAALTACKAANKIKVAAAKAKEKAKAKTTAKAVKAKASETKAPAKRRTAKV